MKRISLLCCFLSLSLLGGCTDQAAVQPLPDESADQTVLYEIQEGTGSPIPAAPEQAFEHEADSASDETPDKAAAIPEEGLPEPMEAPPRQPGTADVMEKIAAISLSVTDGTMYGTEMICWIDGFGLCYDIPVSAKSCFLQIEDGALPETGPYETHRLLLKTEQGTYCLAEVRFDPQKLTANQFGVCYDLVIMDSDLVDIRPVGADWEAIAPMNKDGEIVFDNVHIGIMTSFDAERETIDVLTVEAAKIDAEVGVELLPETLSEEPVTLRVTETAVLAINGNEYEMLITRDRFFVLLEQGYVGFLPEEGEDYFVGCFIGMEQDQLRYLCEISVD